MGKEPTNYARAEAFSACSKPEQIQAPIAGLNMDVAEALCTGRRDPGAVNDFGNMEELDDAGASVSFAPQQAKELGCWNYVSTRNNNFSNRSQKGTICVDEGDYAAGDVGPSGDAVVASSGWISIPPNAISNIQSFSFQSAPKEGAASEEVWIEPVDIDFSDSSYQMEVAVTYEQRVAMAYVNEGGAYVVEDEINVGAVVAIVFAGLVFVGAVMFIVWWQFFKSPAASDEYSVNQGSTY